MPARAGEIRFYVDASALGLGKALERARYDVVHPGHFHASPLLQDDTDDVWMPEVAKRGWIAIGRDKRIRTRPGEKELFARHGLRVFRIVGTKKMSTWDEVVRLAALWDELEQTLIDRPDGPWFMEIRARSIVEVPLPTS